MHQDATPLDVKETTRASYRLRIMRVQRHIQDHLDEPLSLEALAEVACFSPFHFHRVFTAVAGETVAQYIRRLRLERAASDLGFTTLSVTEIAFRAGFDAPESFSRAFRSHFSLPPTLYRTLRAWEFKSPDFDPSTPLLCDGNDDNINTFSQGLPVTVERLEPTPIACQRHVGPYEAVSPVFSSVAAIACERGWIDSNTVLTLLGWDNPNITQFHQIRADCGVTVSPKLTAKDVSPLEIVVIPGGLYAITRFVGHPASVGNAFHWLYETWFPSSGYEADDPPVAIVLPIDMENHPKDAWPIELRLSLTRRRG